MDSMPQIQRHFLRRYVKGLPCCGRRKSQVEPHPNAPARVTQKHRVAVVSELFAEERQKDLVELRIRLPRDVKDRLESLRRDTGSPMDAIARKAIVEFLGKIDHLAQKLAAKNLK